MKFLVELFTKSSWCPEATPLGALRRVRNTRVELVQLLSSGAFSGVWTPFAREKGSMKRLSVESDLKNYPVDDF